MHTLDAEVAGHQIANGHCSAVTATGVSAFQLLYWQRE
jgi:hypothetical protein